MTTYTLEVKAKAICVFDAEEKLEADLLSNAGWIHEDLMSLNHPDGRPLWDGDGRSLFVRLATPEEAAFFQATMLDHIADNDCRDSSDLLAYLVPVLDPTDDDMCLDDVCIECRLAGK